MPVAVAAHALAGAVWVGALFFSYMALMPSAMPLDPPQRAGLMVRVLGKFFPWVWVIIATLVVTGGWMINELGGFGAVGLYVNIMMGIGVVMIGLFLYIYFGPYRGIKAAAAASEWPKVGALMASVRWLNFTNMVLGLVVVVVAAGGRFL